MNKMNEMTEVAATICAVCHDQCVSACPVYEATRRMSAYPSRLAMLALELQRGGLRPDNDTALRLQDCIGCGACLEGCLYVDHPNDVTPAVRWARQVIRPQTALGMETFLEKIHKYGSPYADASERLAALKKELPDGYERESILLYADAATLHYAPEMALSTIRLLRQLGKQNIRLAEHVYAGGELREQGLDQEFRATVVLVTNEIRAAGPAMIIAIHPYSAYLLREVYPIEARVNLNVPVYTLAEFLASQQSRLIRLPGETVFLVQSAVESYRMDGRVGGSLLNGLGVHVSGYREELPYHDMSYPDGEIFGIEPDPRDLLRERITNAFLRSKAKQIVTTSPEAVVGFPRIKVTDLASYLYRS